MACARAEDCQKLLPMCCNFVCFLKLLEDVAVQYQLELQNVHVLLYDVWVSSYALADGCPGAGVCR